jgi:GAF domain-containing protein
VNVTDTAAREILAVGARALSRIDGLKASLQAIVDSIGASLEVESAALFTVNADGRLEIAAWFGLPDEAVAGLVAAVANPGHPIARSIGDPGPSFDVLPTAPGGPALRSHLPLIVTRNGSDIVLGVLALAHDRPMDPATRPLVQAAADLAAVAIERHRPV